MFKLNQIFCSHVELPYMKVLLDTKITTTGDLTSYITNKKDTYAIYSVCLKCHRNKISKKIEISTIDKG